MDSSWRLTWGQGAGKTPVNLTDHASASQAPGKVPSLPACQLAGRRASHPWSPTMHPRIYVTSIHASIHLPAFPVNTLSTPPTHRPNPASLHPSLLPTSANLRVVEQAPMILIRAM